MHRTLSEHISRLEERLAELNRELESPLRSPFERDQIRVDIGIAERSLTHFRKAHELERKIYR